VLFMQGGAIAENAIVPMNMLRGKASADYIDTGEWSKKSIKEAKKYGQGQRGRQRADSGYTTIPPRSTWKLDPAPPTCTSAATRPSAASNTTSRPTWAACRWWPTCPADILSRPVDVSKYGLIYGGAQKNIGPAGLTIVIVRDDLLGQAHPARPTPSTTSCRPPTTACYNTPPTYAIYIAGLVFKWIKAQGGLAAMEAHNRPRPRCCTTTSTPATSTAARWPGLPLLMNVPFKLHDPALDGAFLKGAEARGWCSSRATKSVGGMRASIYNAMPIEGVQALVGGAGRELHRGRGRRHARPAAGQPAQGLRRGAPAHPPAADVARRGHRRRPPHLLARAVAGAVPRVAQPQPPAPAAHPGGEQRRGRAHGLRGSRSPAPSPATPRRSSTGSTSSRPTSRTIPTTRRASWSSPTTTPGPRARTAPRWCSPRPTGRGRSTACSSRWPATAWT
jgi:phosphoserine aminotransferase